MQQYTDLLGLFPGFTLAELSSAFKAQIKQCHPDGSKPDEELAKELIVAYKVLKSTAAFTETGRVVIRRQPVIIQLGELAELCTTCVGLGEVPIQEFKEHSCVHCEGTGLLPQPCRRCSDPAYLDKTGVCRACKGAKKFFAKTWVSPRNYCPYCRGSGSFVSEVVSTTKFKTCTCCAGEGKKEIKVFNPVLRGILLPKKA